MRPEPQRDEGYSRLVPDAGLYLIHRLAQFRWVKAWPTVFRTGPRTTH
jgi:hypothetical protein